MKWRKFMVIHLYHIFYAMLAMCAASAVYSIVRMLIQPGWRP
jgi:hypothetical protein